MHAGPPEEPKMVCYDDALPIIQSAEGRALLERDTLRGRSLTTVPVVVSQNASHLVGETLLSNLGGSFVFQLPDRREAEAGCRVLDIAPTDENLRLIQAIGPDLDSDEPPDFAECVMRDLHGRAGRVQIDLQTDEMRTAFCTTPGRRWVPEVVEQVG